MSLENAIAALKAGGKAIARRGDSAGGSKKRDRLTGVELGLVADFQVK